MNKNKFFEEYINNHNPLDLDFDAALDSIDRNINASGNQGTPQLLTLDQLDNLDELVDKTEGWHSARPDRIISKAERLSKAGYQLVNYSYKCVHYGRGIYERFIKPSTIDEVRKYGILDYKGGYMEPRQDYAFLREYEDKQNKVYYFCFSKQIYGESMWC